MVNARNDGDVRLPLGSGSDADRPEAEDLIRRGRGRSARRAAQAIAVVRRPRPRTAITRTAQQGSTAARASIVSKAMPKSPSTGGNRPGGGAPTAGTCEPDGRPAAEHFDYPRSERTMSPNRARDQQRGERGTIAQSATPRAATAADMDRPGRPQTDGHVHRQPGRWRSRLAALRARPGERGHGAEHDRLRQHGIQ